MVNLEEKAHDLRLSFLKSRSISDAGHLSGVLGVMDILTALYYSVLKENNRFICGGYYYPGVYTILADKGIISQSQFRSMDTFGTSLYLDGSIRGTEISAFSSLGQSISMANGVLFANRINSNNHLCYTLVGDGELNEGQNWEAIDTASKYDLNARVIVSLNGSQLDGNTDEIKNLNLRDKFTASRWNVIEVESGNDPESISKILGSVPNGNSNHNDDSNNTLI
jgi:transketolase